MAESDDQSRRGKPGEQLPLPLDERAQLSELLRQVEAGEITPDRVKRRLLMLFHTGIGGVTRALAIADVKAALEVAEGLSHSVAALVNELRSREGGTQSQRAPSFETRLVNKERDILQRELDIFRSITTTNQARQSKELLAMLRIREKDLKEATLTAHLNRLNRDNLIDRPRKGHYRSTPQSRPYLEALEELGERLGLTSGSKTPE